MCYLYSSYKLLKFTAVHVKKSKKCKCEALFQRAQICWILIFNIFKKSQNYFIGTEA